MQTTLLALAVAFILALIAALVGPFFIDWNRYKPQFEFEAARVIGAPVRVEGALDARLLPAPILRLRKLSIGAPDDASKVSADKLDVEFSLGSLLRGEWRATELSLEGVALDLGLDKQGRIDWPSAKGRFNLGALAIDRLNLAGRVDLHDAASGAQFRLDDLVFNGDVRTLATGMRGEGYVNLAGVRTPFRVSTGQTADNKGTRLRLTLDPGARDLSADLDGVMTFEALSPRFDGAVMLARNSGNPWRISAKTAASPATATFDQIELAYGPDDVALKFSGAGEMKFSSTPRLQAKLSAPQLDMDRWLAKRDQPSTPIKLMAGLRDLIAAIPPAPVPMQIDIYADQIALGGRALQNAAASMRGDSKSWALDKFEFQSLGNTRFAASGLVQPAGPDANFAGPVSFSTDTAKAIANWLQGGESGFSGPETPLRVTGNATILKDRADLDALKFSVASAEFEGRVSRSDQGVDAALKSPSVDIGSIRDFTSSLVRLQALSPSRLRVSFDIAKARVEGRPLGPLTFDLELEASQASQSQNAFGLVVRHANLGPWIGMPQELTNFTSKLIVANDKLSFDNFGGKLGGAQVKGNLSLTRGDEPIIGGNIEADAISIGTLTGLALGTPERDATGSLSAAPFNNGWFGWRGSVAVAAGKAGLPGGMELTSVSGVVRTDGQSLVFDDVKAGLGGSTAMAKLQAARSASGTSVNAKMQFAGVDGASLHYRSLTMPESKASLKVTLASEGRSAAALVNALSGDGVLTLDNANIAGLDPAAFEAATHFSEGVQSIDDAKLKAVVEPVLARGALPVSTVQIPFEIRDGRFRVAATLLDGGAARAILSGGYDLPADQADIRATLSSSVLGTQSSRPEIRLFLNGAPDALTRTLDTSGLSSWLAVQAIERETRRLDQLEGKAGLTAPAAPPAMPSSVPKAAAPASQVTPLPPPIDIRPAPGARPKKPRQPAPQDLSSPGAAF